MRAPLAAAVAAIAALLVMTAGAGQAVPAAGAQAASPAHAAGLAREVRLTLREGTSMAAALSPDGRTLAIDLLGALWTLAASGGPATRILEDGYDARMPAWSPDGRHLAFQAYRDSTWDLWTISADGSGLRPLTSGPFDDREPHWSPDGTRLAFSSDRGGQYDVWVLTLATGDLRRLTASNANDSMPAWAPDGREIAFVSDREARGVYAVAADSGIERLLHAEPATAGAPAYSPDGRSVSYTVIDGSASRLVADGVNIAAADEDVFPFRVHWASPTDLVYTADGTIKRRSVAGGPSRTIPFTAEVAFTRPAFTPVRRALVPGGPQPVRGLMHPAISPDGTRIAFVALGDLWIMPAEGGGARPARLTRDSFVVMDPAWSPDGTSLAFSTDRDGSMDLWIRDMRDGRERRLAAGATSPAWSPDGARLAFLDAASQLAVVEVAGGTVTGVPARFNEPGRPSWSPDGRAVVVGALRPYSTRFREGHNQVARVALEAGDVGGRVRWFDPLPHTSTGMRDASGPAWAPDGRHMAAIVNGVLVVWPVAADGTPIGPPRQLSSELAHTPSWTGDSRQLLYQTADRFRIVDVRDGRTRDITPRLTWTVPPAPAGRLTVHAGRLFDGRTDTLREHVDIVIEDGRVARVEPHHPDHHQSRVVDASAHTVLPGLIESHMHRARHYGERLGRIWLAFGITSVRNPAANPFEAIEDREATAFGARPGPRVFTTGGPLDGTRIYYPGGAALDGGVQFGAELAQAGALRFDFIKTYVRLPDLLQRRAIEEAHRLGMPVTSHELYPAVAYGADGVEHIRGTSRRGYSTKMSELRRSYRDVVDLLAASGATITPTIGIQGGYPVMALRDGSWLDDPRTRLFPDAAWQATRDLRADPAALASLGEREALVASQEHFVAALVDAGGRVIAGTDAPIIPYGLSLLLELEHYVRGGLSPFEALRAATIVPAEAMGYGADLGTIEPGKLADLVIVDGNPLTDIRDLRRTHQVVIGGIVHAVDTLVAGPRHAPAPPARR